MTTEHRHATHCALLLRNQACDCPLARIAELELIVGAALAVVERSDLTPAMREVRAALTGRVTL